MRNTMRQGEISSKPVKVRNNYTCKKVTGIEKTNTNTLVTNLKLRWSPWFAVIFIG